MLRVIFRRRFSTVNTAVASAGGMFKGFVEPIFISNASVTMPSDITYFNLSNGQKYIIVYIWSNYDLNGSFMLRFANSSSTSCVACHIIGKDASVSDDYIKTDFQDATPNIKGVYNNTGTANNWGNLVHISYNPSTRVFTRIGTHNYNPNLYIYYC